MSNPQPIIYQRHIDIRFGDLDPYGHVNAQHYLDMVASSRLLYLEEEMKFPIRKMFENHLGLFLRKATQSFLRPITGVQRVCVRSFVSRIEKSLVTVDYEIRNSDQSTIFASGGLDYVSVDLRTSRPMDAPDWLIDLVYSK